MVIMNVYCLLMKTFEKYVQVLVSDIRKNKQEVTNMYDIAKLQNISKSYLKIYFCSQSFITYHSPNIVIVMVGLNFVFLLLILIILFHALEGNRDIFGIVLLFVTIPYGV